MRSLLFSALVTATGLGLLSVGPGRAEARDPRWHVVDDDWEDYWDDRREALEDLREEWEDRREEWEDRFDDDRRRFNRFPRGNAWGHWRHAPARHRGYPPHGYYTRDRWLPDPYPANPYYRGPGGWVGRYDSPGFYSDRYYPGTRGRAHRYYFNPGWYR